MTDYEWLAKMNLCRKCRRDRPAPGKTLCFDCLAEMREYYAKRYDPEKAKGYQGRRREIYREKKAAGICVRCNRAATHGMYCYEHSIGERRKSISRAEAAKRKRHERGLVPEARKEKGLCLWCGEKAVPGLQCCEGHRKIFSQAGKKAKENDKVVEGIWELKKQGHLLRTSGMRSGQKTQ